MPQSHVARTVAQTVPSLITGLAVVLLYGFENQLHLLIAAALAFVVVLQIRLLLGKTVLQLTRRFEWVILSGIGFLHGLTNLGGGFLAAYSSLSSRNRVETRSKIALGYSVFVVVRWCFFF